MRSTRVLWLTISMLVFSAKGVPSAGAEETPTIPIVFPDGFTVHAEVAATPDIQTHGLMGRGALPSDRGMLFVFDDDKTRTFWMKEMRVDLDFVFLGSDQRIRKIVESVPHPARDAPDEDIPRVEGQARYVLELPAGTSRVHRLSPGDRLEFDLPATSP